MAAKTTKTGKPTTAETPVVELKEEDLDETLGACPSLPTRFAPKAKNLIQSIGR